MLILLIEQIEDSCPLSVLLLMMDDVKNCSILKWNHERSENSRIFLAAPQKILQTHNFTPLKNDVHISHTQLVGV